MSFLGGGKDEYVFIAEINLSNEQYEWNVPDSLALIGFEFQDKNWIKLLLETSENSSNIWLGLTP